MDSYWLFTSIWLVAAATPGADTMLLLTTSIANGWKSAIPISLGITAAKIVLLTVAFFGLSAVLTTAPQTFVILKLFGCGFLLWRAIKLWRSSGASAQEAKPGFWNGLSMAFSIAFSNPQAMLFYIAVVPQVTQTTNPWILNAIIAVGFTLISAFYVGLAVPIRAWINRGDNQLALNRAIAVIFAALAGIVAFR